MIYLDHAATSWPKPDSVVAACQHWFTHIGISAERGDGPRTREAFETVQRVRQGIAAMTGHPAGRIAFCSGATEGLNLVLRALLSNESRVMTTPFEHSSVVRALLALRDQRNLTIDVPDRGAAHGPTTDAICEALHKQPARVLVFTHASNITGGVFDAKRICETARKVGTQTVLDVSQTAGYLPLDVGADVVVGSCHKAMHGPPGLGFVSAHADLAMLPQKYGGTGSSVALERHPTEWPQAFEAGTPNTPALFGTAAALHWLGEHGPDVLLDRSLVSLNKIEAGLRELPKVRVLSPGTTTRTPVLSFVHDDYDPIEIGTILSGQGIHARAGFHCAPWAHEQLGTSAAGTVRIATGPNTSDHDATALLQVLKGL
jgi:selenocysteine lyase/cysteine desulfurase